MIMKKFNEFINENESKITEKKLGTFGVDSGIFMIADPGYVDTFTKGGKALLPLKAGEVLLSGEKGTGVVIETASDGGYDVIGKFNEGSEVPFEIIIKLKTIENK